MALHCNRHHIGHLGWLDLYRSETRRKVNWLSKLNMNCHPQCYPARYAFWHRGTAYSDVVAQCSNIWLRAVTGHTLSRDASRDGMMRWRWRVQIWRPELRIVKNARLWTPRLWTDALSCLILLSWTLEPSGVTRMPRSFYPTTACLRDSLWFLRSHGRLASLAIRLSRTISRGNMARRENNLYWDLKFVCKFIINKDQLLTTMWTILVHIVIK